MSPYAYGQGPKPIGFSTYLTLDVPHRYAQAEYPEAFLQYHSAVSYGIAVATYRPNHDFHEFGIARVSFSRANRWIVDSVGQLVNSALAAVNATGMMLALRYEYAFACFRQSTSRWRPYIGAVVTPYLDHVAVWPQTASTFPQNYTALGALISFAPRLRWAPNERVGLDLRVAADLLDVDLIWRRVHNPTLPERAQRISGFEFVASPLGLGLSLGFSYLLVTN
jgi:hypothetical protein